MSRMLRPFNLSFALIAAFALVAGTVVCANAQAPQAAQATWVDKVNNSLAFYKKQYTTVTYPGSNWKTSDWEPYEKKLAVIRDAVKQGDKGKAKAETDEFLKMLLNREHGIHTTAAGGLYAETLIYMYPFFKEEKKS
jgi:hypothetical protein